MSLSSWIRDYVFFPLAAWRRSNRWSLVVLVLSMIVFGVWHGASWCFFVWGLYQGIALALHRVWKGNRSPSSQQGSWVAVVGWAGTFLVVSVGWLIFRADGLGQSARLVGSLLRFDRPSHLPTDFHLLVGVFLALYAVWLLLGPHLRRWLETPSGRMLGDTALPVCRFCMILLVIIWSDQSSPFVYVRF